MSLVIRAHAASDRGRVREGNEDNLFVGSSVFAVADGMGGHQAGEIASETALEPLRRLDGQPLADPDEVEQRLRQAIATANATVIDKAAQSPSFRGMGTTLTAVAVLDDRLYVAHVGDSRAYLLRPGEGMSQLTTDHTLVEELVQEGRLSRDEVSTHPQRSIITRAIGVDRTVEVDSLKPITLRPGDQVLLCSDGLTGPVADEDIGAILQREGDGEAACAALVAAANAAGGPDNITVVLVRVTEEDSPRADPAGVPATTGRSAPTRADAGRTRDPTTGAAARPDAAETERIRAAAIGAAPVRKAGIQIRTRQAEPTGWDARRMGEVGAPQGAGSGAGRLHRRRRTAGLAAVAAAAVAVLIGWLLLAGSYFVGVDAGAVAIFRGLPEEVAGVPLHWLVERSDVVVTDLSAVRRERLEAGITVGSVAEGRRLVATYRRTGAAAPAATPQATASARPPTAAGAGTPDTIAPTATP